MQTSALAAPPAALDPPPLPISLPLEYRTRDGATRLAYARSPWHPRRYLVMEFGCLPGRAKVDLECVHDDFGQLVPMRQRTVAPGDDVAGYMRWTPIGREVQP